MKKIIGAAAILLLTVFLAGDVYSQQASLPPKQVKKWYAQKHWLNGLERTPHHSVNKQEFATQYHANKEWWDMAFAYLRETDFAGLKPGRYAIDGENVFVIVSEGPTKDLDKTMWEAHKNYIDIHYVISGSENIGITPVTSTTISIQYDPAKDIAFYTGNGEYYKSDTNNFFIVFPQDAHRPGIKNETSDTVKKVVIKVRKS